MKDFKPLDHYYTHLMNESFANLLPTVKGITNYGPMLGLLLDRQGQFQVELFIAPPNIQLIEYHSHPNVDVYEVHVAGNFILDIEGIQYLTPETDMKMIYKNPIFIPAGAIHGLLIKDCASFLSIQHWKNGIIPTSIGYDFIVDHKHPNHDKGLQALDRKDKPIIRD
jgi:hypothetical protein